MALSGVSIWIPSVAAGAAKSLPSVQDVPCPHPRRPEGPPAEPSLPELAVLPLSEPTVPPLPELAALLPPECALHPRKPTVKMSAASAPNELRTQVFHLRRLRCRIMADHPLGCSVSALQCVVPPQRDHRVAHISHGGRDREAVGGHDSITASPSPPARRWSAPSMRARSSSLACRTVIPPRPAR